MIENGLIMLEQGINGLANDVISNINPLQVLCIVHIFGVGGNWSVRYDDDNCEALCYGCHSYLGGNPNEHHEYKLEKLGEERFEALRERRNDHKSGSRTYYLSKEFRKIIKEKMEKL